MFIFSPAVFFFKRSFKGREFFTIFIYDRILLHTYMSIKKIYYYSIGAFKPFIYNNCFSVIERRLSLTYLSLFILYHSGIGDVKPKRN